MVPMKKQNAETVAEALFHHCFSLFGLPKQIRSDRGAQYLSNFIKRLCELLDIKRVYTSGYCPRSNILAEKTFGKLSAALKCYIENQNDWPNKLSAVLWGLKGTCSSHTTFFSPFQVMFGRLMRMPGDIETSSILSAGPKASSADEYVNKMVKRI